ncbi:Rpn family recombination-promoting nuclease/putative transposase [Halanaerobacter jeridensis]|uniref:Transposase/invertase (TIGR01784 family) n=1 Tax=Halanaerobacter jeridensis TaxID=706427 RepID=A0A939BPC3_9FIRM|nr:Rpn family recombination-promoting nuclease/putative transposase [Halanaerobacter jeridensis]MBM7556852.1 putative transposase/invertase (TIGR01784 family) [Halanaerobacter jeridensis]
MEQEMPDLLWKEIIEDLFEDFIKFFLPDLYSRIDFSQGYEFLDKELANIVDKTLKGKRMSDRLVKVYLEDGTENWILAHLEVQGYKEKEFSERMFRYFYRIYDRYNKKITALAIFSEDNEGYKPNKFEYEFYGTKIDYQYNTYKILEQNEEELLASDNPFALVVLAGLYALEAKNEEQRRYKFKKKLFGLLINRGYERDKAYNIFQFLDGILFLPTALEKEFQKNIVEIIGGDDMGVKKEMTNLYQAGKEEGIKEGELKLVKNLLETDVEIDKIAEASGLSKEQIERIKEKSQH